MKVATVLVACLSVLAPAWAAEGVGTYVLEERDSRSITGRKGVTAHSDIPFGKGYAELTADEKAIVRARYKDLRAEDEPPYPEGGLQVLGRDLNKVQDRVRVEGDLSVRVQVDARGDAQSVTVLETPDAAVSRAVAYALVKARYKPARCAGEPCAMDFPFQVRFRLRN